jgi:hypothetical protein
MVLAFTQLKGERDIIFIKKDDGFVVQRRFGLIPISDRHFEKEGEAEELYEDTVKRFEAQQQEQF